MSNQPRQTLLRRRFAGSLAAGGTVVFLLTLANFRFGHDDLALGWDTPLYVGYLRFIATKGISAFLSSRGFYNVVYSLAGNSVDAFVSNPQQTEAWFPVFLAGLLVVLVGQLTWIGSQSIQTSTFASLFSIPWLAPYRLASDLHPALAGMTIFLGILVLLSEGQKRIHWSSAVIAGLMLLLAFTHAETAVFAAFVLSASALLRMFVDGRERRIANTLSWVMGPWITIAPGVAALYYRLSLFTTS